MAQPEHDDGTPTGPATVRRIHSQPADPVRAFRVDVDGYVRGDDADAREVAGTVAYVVRLAAAVGSTLGAGDLDAIEVTGPATVYAAVLHRLSGQLDVVGLLDPTGSSPETLHDRLHGGGP